MVKVSFLLTEPKADKPTPIFAFVSFDGQRVKVYTGVTAHPRQWLKAEQKLQTRGYAQNGLLNDTLDEVRQRLEMCYKQNRAAGQLPSADDLRQAVVPRQAEPVKAEVPAPAATFWTIHEQFVTLIREQGQPRTAQASATAGRHLREFGRHARLAIDFDTLTPAMGDKFAAYLLKAGQTDNTIAKQFVRIKRFMKWAADRGYHNSVKYQQLTWQRHDPEILTLTEEEVKAIEQLPLDLGSYLDNARALFLLACYTGLRYSDLVSIKPEHLKGLTLRLTIQKTRETVSIPLSPRAQVLIERYLAGGVRLITNQRLNEYLKELGQKAGIDEPFELIRYRGGRREASTIPKWQRIGCHTGRRTFVTLNLERGLRPEIIMKVTGHKDWKSFQRYVNITDAAVERAFNAIF